MGAARVWKLDETGAPAFPVDYEIVRRAALQVTDLTTNRNKYYALELHRASVSGRECFRVFTHYGRTDDLETNPEAGQKECRFFADAAAAEANYLEIYRAKTAARKGYREVALAASRIGSARARGSSSGEIDPATALRVASAANDNAGTAPRPSTLHPALQGLIVDLYAEATHALTSTIAATITARGIETPLGVLTLGQIEKGEAILREIHALAGTSGASTPARLLELSGEFYSVVPFRIGRSRTALEAAVIASAETIAHKQDTLQLMKDMLRVDGSRGGVLFDADVDRKYAALGCELRALEPGSDEFRAVRDRVLASRVRPLALRVQRVFAVRRGPEHDGFAREIGNERQLFHGSRTKNWVGILSRGILLPRLAVRFGAARTDAGWLGNGIYFGDAACTSAAYAAPGRAGTRYMAVARVALGRPKDFHKITHGLSAPPAGYDSCHGVRSRAGVRSDFADDEWVVYSPRQQRLEYLLEFAA